MKSTLLKVLILAPFLISAQVDSTVKKELKKQWAVGFNFSVENNYRISSSEYPPNTYDKVAALLDEVEKPGLSFNIGLQLRFPLTRNIAFKTGLMFANRAYSNEGYLYYDTQVARDWATQVGPKEKASFWFYEFPLLFDFHIETRNEKWQYGLYVGSLMTLNMHEYKYASRMNEYFYSSPDRIPYYHEKNGTFRLGVTTGLSINYSINDRIDLCLTPSYSYFYKIFLSSIYEVEGRGDVIPMSYFPVIEKPYAYGVGLTVLYKF